MAQVYARIGAFYRDITMHVIEANDRGKYALLYEDIWSLLGQVAGDEQESEIVKLELLGFSQNAMLQYATKFRQDGIEKTQLEELYHIISLEIAKIVTTTEKTEQKKKNIIAFLEDTKSVIDNAFASEVGA